MNDKDPTLLQSSVVILMIVLCIGALIYLFVNAQFWFWYAMLFFVGGFFISILEGNQNER